MPITMWSFETLPCRRRLSSGNHTSSAYVPVFARASVPAQAATLFSFERRPLCVPLPPVALRSCSSARRLSARGDCVGRLRFAGREVGDECRYAGANLENYIAAKVTNKVKILRANGGCLGARSR